jgi:hypothetical protein
MLITLYTTSARRRWLLAVIVLLTLAIVLVVADGDRGSIYGSRNALIEAQKRDGYVQVGSFGRSDWPAIVVSRETGQGGVAFTTADGQPHRYQGFAGPMKALEFRAGLGGGKRFTLVFHRVPKNQGGGY